ncbi:hypothetical protein HY626_02215, partial [Candidatus Uhrbacteria bacterium]|nr:hypothetical protein [Candidatus Uhrbacteria bacterium]
MLSRNPVGFASIIVIGDVMSDFRVELAQCLWNCGLGRDPAVNASDFEDYLDGIPQIPASLIAEDPDLPFLSLADPRPGLLQSCKLLGIKYEELGYTDEDAVPFDDRFVTPTTPFWFRHDDGR